MPPLAGPEGKRAMKHVLWILAVLALVIVLVGLVSALILRQAVAQKDDVISQHGDTLLLLEDFIGINEHAARKARSFLLTGNERFLKERHQSRQDLARQLLVLIERMRSPDEQRLLERVRQLERELEREMDTLLELRQQGMSAEESGRGLERSVQPIRDEMDATLAELKRHKLHMMDSAKLSAGRAVTQAFVLLAVAVGASILLCGVLGMMLLRSWRQLLDAAGFQQRVVAIVGHDVRSPLTAILASTSHALMQPGVDERTGSLLSRLHRSARRIEVLTKLLMDFSQSRLEPGLALAPEPGDLHAVCEHVITEARETWTDRVITLEKVGDGRGDFDKDRLVQALANLVDNALRHGAKDTRVTVVSRGANPSVLEVAICNEGPPIDPALLPYIFEPFRHGRPPHEVVRESMGMGLYIVMEVARAHGGRVDVDSTPERTTFTLRLPRVPVPPGRVKPRG
jgi:signal transduction histidine kinase